MMRRRPAQVAATTLDVLIRDAEGPSAAPARQSAHRRSCVTCDPRRPLLPPPLDSIWHHDADAGPCDLPRPPLWC